MVPIEGATFDCTFKEVIGCRLRTDYKVEMTGEKYSTIGLLAVSLSAVFIIVGIPASYLIAMLSHRQKIDVEQKEQETVVQWVKRRNAGAQLDEATMAYKDLFITLKPCRWYFEVVNLVRQFILNGFLIMFQTSARTHLLLSIFTLLGHAILVYIFDPYVDSNESRTHYFCSTALVAMMVGQLAMLSLAENVQLADEAGDQHEALLCAYAIGIVFAMVMVYGFYVTFSAAETILGENALAVLEEAQAM